MVRVKLATHSLSGNDADSITINKDVFSYTIFSSTISARKV